MIKLNIKNPAVIAASLFFGFFFVIQLILGASILGFVAEPVAPAVANSLDSFFKTALTFLKFE